MFIDTVPNRSSPPAILLREAYREGGKAKKRTLANLSKLPPDLIAGIRALLAGAKAVGPGADGFQIARALPHGHVAAALGLVRKIALDRLLLSTAKDAQSRRHRDLVVALLIDRLVAPRSKLASVRGLNEDSASTSLGPVLGLGPVAEREIYDALDWLGAQQARVEAGLARRHLKDGTLVLYDVSSSYLEGRCCPLGRHGYSRDHRPDRLQIVYGLLCAADGCPVAVEVFAGNTADPATLADQVAKVKERFGLSRVVLVGDRGMVTAARIAEDLEPAGLDWVTSLRAPQIRKLAEDGPLQLSLFDTRDLAEIAAPDYPGERLIVCRNPLLAAERARKRDALLEATERTLQRLADQVRRRRPGRRKAAEIGLAVGAVLDKRKMAKHFAVDIADGRLTWRRRTDAIAAEARFDGIYVIRTNVPAEDLDADQAVQVYKDLARVEWAFRSLKTSELEIRPIRHWKAERVRAHVFLCLLAYHVEWHLRQAWKPLLFDDPEPEVGRARRRSPVAPAEPSPVAQTKRTTRRTEDALPVMGFTQLIRHLGTLTRNTVRVPLQGAHSFTAYAHPTKLQQRAFDLLAIDPKRVQ